MNRRGWSRARRVGGTGMRRLSPKFLQQMLADAYYAAGVEGPSHVWEHRFDPTRRWKFDLAWPMAKVAVEFQGRFGTGHRGTYRGKPGLDLDCEKACAAAAAGWLLLPVSYGMLRRDMSQVVEWIYEAVKRGLAAAHLDSGERRPVE